YRGPRPPSRAADRTRRHARLRAALSPFDGAAAQGRAEHRLVPPGRRRPGRRAPDSAAAVRLSSPASRSGRGGVRVAPRARQARRTHPHRGGLDMQLGMIGLGRMGNGMTDRLREFDHDVRTFDPNVESRTAVSLEELKTQLDAPRAFWMMVPAGDVTAG